MSAVTIGTWRKPPKSIRGTAKATLASGSSLHFRGHEREMGAAANAAASVPTRNKASRSEKTPTSRAVVYDDGTAHRILVHPPQDLAQGRAGADGPRRREISLSTRSRSRERSSPVAGHSPFR